MSFHQSQPVSHQPLRWVTVPMKLLRIVRCAHRLRQSAGRNFFYGGDYVPE